MCMTSPRQTRRAAYAVYAHLTSPPRIINASEEALTLLYARPEAYALKYGSLAVVLSLAFEFTTLAFFKQGEHLGADHY